MKTVVIGVAQDAYYNAGATHPPVVWIAGIFGERDEAEAWVNGGAEGKAIALAQRAAQARGLQGTGDLDEINEYEDVHEATYAELKKLDPKLPDQVADFMAGWRVSYLVRDGEIRGFWVD